MSHRTLRLFALLSCVSTPASPAAAQWKTSTPGEFGRAIAIGNREVFVSQPGNPYAPGMVYVYRSDVKGTWRQTAKLTMHDASNGDDFGRAIAHDPAAGLLLVSSTLADSGRGAVFVFTRARGSWTQTGRFTALDAQPRDGFGRVIVLTGQRAYVSSNRQKGRGAVYVFRRTGTTLTPESTLTASETVPGQFGGALAAQGDRLLIGSVDADSNGGVVYAYVRNPTTNTWKLEDRIVSPGRRASRGSSWDGR